MSDPSRFFSDTSPIHNAKVPTAGLQTTTPAPSSPLIKEQSINQQLFVQDDDEEESDTQEDDNGYTLFESQIQGIIPDICPTDISKLHSKFKDHENAVLTAVNAYYDSEHVTEVLPPAGPIQQLSKVDHRVSGGRINSSPINQRIRALSSSQSSNRKKQKADFSQKKLPRHLQWRRFIGSLQVVAWATRPTVKPLPYGTDLTVVKNSNSEQTSKRGRGGANTSVSSYIKLIQNIDDPSARKEIGRIPEDVATILHPLVGQDLCDFDVTVVFCDGRLSIGDSFIVQLDCYLTSKIFENKAKVTSSKEDFKLMKQSQAAFTTKVQETPEEQAERKTQVSLVKLFNKLEFKVSKDTEDEHDQQNEVIDLEADDEEINSRNSTPSDGAEHDDELNLNQLKEFYKRTQTEKILTSLPETETAENFKLSLRSYQKQGLTWMLRSERELENKYEGDLMNPLWKEFRWPKDRSWRASRDKSFTSSPESEGDSKFFYANLYSGELSLTKPVLKSLCRGGILADEMGLGKTISTLALIHNAPFDKEYNKEESTEKTYAYSTTLVVVPTSLLAQWQDEFLNANNDDSRILVYYGSETGLNLRDALCNSKTPYLVVFTTYGTIQHEWTKLQNAINNETAVDVTGLFSVKYFRVVLDEGHIIRNRMAKTTKACYTIQASRKWLLTGTPIINRLDDLYSLVKFLQLEPWSNISYWSTFVSSPFEKKNYKQALDVIQAILEPVLLRRTKNMKKNGKPLVELPPKEVVVERIKFSPKERNLYNWFLARAESSVTAGIRRGNLLKNYTSILVHILRLRQICDHMDLIKSGGDEMDEDVSSSKLNTDISDVPKELLNNPEKLSSEEFTRIKTMIHDRFKSLAALECSICTTQPIPFDNIAFTSCGHAFCQSCILEHCDYQELKANPTLCPNCRTEISTSNLLKPKSNLFAVEDSTADKSENFTLHRYDNALRSSKLNALLAHLRVIRDTSPNDKVVVFSQFSAYLGIMERELRLENGLRVLTFHGALSMEKRSEILKKFKEPRTGVTVLLISLKAGGVGLNLTEASRAFMCDPWWSPSVEDQAIDRIHRIGQNNSVKVVRFIMEGSIEEKMLKIQERKRTIGEAVETEEEERRKRRVEEIQMLFEST
jgi:DNA repair protein RAD5